MPTSVLPAAYASCAWPDQMHVFQALPRMTPEAAKAMTYVAQFIRSTTARGDL